MQKLMLVCLSASVVMLSSCTTARFQPKTTGTDVFATTQQPRRGNTEWPDEQEPERQRPRRARNERRRIDDVDRIREKPYESTNVRLQLFREDIELDDIDVDFDSLPDGSLFETERKRTGFRAEFGRNGTGGFVQVFREKLQAPTLLIEEFTNHGIGFGALGAPVVHQTRHADLIVPWRIEVDLVGGSERVGAGNDDQDLFYAESNFELGFGARAFGVQASSGLIANSLAGTFDTDVPTSSDADISGTNIGAFFEVLYKHPRVPLMARARAIAGDVQGIMLSFGFAF